MTQYGKLAQEYCQVDLPVQVLQSAAGFYLGTFHPEEGPYSRESDCYWPTREAAQIALASGDWPQKPHP
jgi:hypothetical protein